MNKFVRVAIANLTVGPRVYARGSVVEVPEDHAAYLVKGRVAEPHPGPASEPEPAPEPEPGPRAEADPAPRKTRTKGE